MSAIDLPTRRRWLLPIALLAIAAALLAVGTVLLVRTHTGSDVSTNTAITDRRTTAQVSGQVSTALEQVFSYDSARPAVAQAAARRWLGGKAPKQYALLLAQLGKLAPDQKLSFVAKVISAGVQTLHGDSATLLVFVDQQGTRATTGQSSVSAGQVRIVAQRHGGTWKIVDIHPY